MVNVNRLPMPLIETYEWQYEGACNNADPDTFFSPEFERGPRRAAREAKAKSFCATCPVVQQCREHALSVQEPYGVWGGLTVNERAEILAGRKAQPLAS